MLPVNFWNTGLRPLWNVLSVPWRSSSIAVNKYQRQGLAESREGSWTALSVTWDKWAWIVTGRGAHQCGGEEYKDKCVWSDLTLLRGYSEVVLGTYKSENPCKVRFASNLLLHRNFCPFKLFFLAYCDWYGEQLRFFHGIFKEEKKLLPARMAAMPSKEWTPLFSKPVPIGVN